ncbi:UDP-glycosyltransferase UGT5-like [Arctopsyche grandis]|uniref:UDP-glycosyltransferase UGT5-like n=1 Tax=Arctopsyche grandis TaxID=121162 RepID=UPI00406D6A8A
MFTLSYIYLVFFAVGFSSGARILGIFPTPSISHQVVFRYFMEALARRGHHVVTMTTDPVKYEEKIPNLTQIDVHDISYEKFNKEFKLVDVKEKKTKGISVYQEYITFVADLLEIQMKTSAMKSLLNDPSEKFDLCLFEVFVPTAFPIKDHFNCSMILISSMTAGLQDFEAFGNPSNPILYPDFLTSYMGDLTFWNRLNSVIHDLNYRYRYSMIWLPMIDFYARRIFGENCRPVDEIRKDADMMFLNESPLLGSIKPTVPGIIYLGNMHIRPNKPLPSNPRNFPYTIHKSSSSI